MPARVGYLEVTENTGFKADFFSFPVGKGNVLSLVHQDVSKLQKEMEDLLRSTARSKVSVPATTTNFFHHIWSFKTRPKAVQTFARILKLTIRASASSASPWEG